MGRKFDGSDGRYLCGWMRATMTRCPHCASAWVDFRVWETFGQHEADAQYRCQNCSKIWWVDAEFHLRTEVKP